MSGRDRDRAILWSSRHRLPEEPGHDRDFAILTACRSLYFSEASAVWSEGEKASLFFELPATGTEHLLCFELTPFTAQNVTLSAKGEQLAEWKLSGGVARKAVTVSSRDGRFVHLQLAIDSPTSPASLGRSNDTRRLGVALSELALVEERSACLPENGW